MLARLTLVPRSASLPRLHGAPFAVANQPELQTDPLMVALYDELRGLAEARLAQLPVGQTLQSNELVHEVWARFRRHEHQHWESQAHFFGAASQAMRDVLIERLRARKRHKRGGHNVRTTLPPDLALDTVDDDLVLAVHEALEVLETISAPAARVSVMRYFGGMSVDEIAQALGTSVSSVERHWRFARAWLRDRLDAPPES